MGGRLPFKVSGVGARTFFLLKMEILFEVKKMKGMLTILNPCKLLTKKGMSTSPVSSHFILVWLSCHKYFKCGAGDAYSLLFFIIFGRWTKDNSKKIFAGKAKLKHFLSSLSCWHSGAKQIRRHMSAFLGSMFGCSGDYCM